MPLSCQVFIVMVILVILLASASVGLAVGVVFFHAVAIVLASPLVVLLSAAVLLHYGFGLGGVALTTAGALTALQSFYLLGAAMRYLTSDDRQARCGPGFERPPMQQRYGHDHITTEDAATQTIEANALTRVQYRNRVRDS
jgi:hypothetical protein